MAKNKVKVGYSIDNLLNEDFNKYCEERSINKSKLVNKILNDYLKKQTTHNEQEGKR